MINYHSSRNFGLDHHFTFAHHRNCKWALRLRLLSKQVFHSGFTILVEKIDPIAIRLRWLEKILVVLLCERLACIRCFLLQLYRLGQTGFDEGPIVWLDLNPYSFAILRKSNMYIHRLDYWCWCFCIYSQEWMDAIAILMNTTCPHFSVWVRHYFNPSGQYASPTLAFFGPFDTEWLALRLCIFRCMIQLALRTGQWHMLIGLKESGIQDHTQLKISV